MKTHFSLLLSSFLFFSLSTKSQPRPREMGIKIGVLPTGNQNAITDVAGVKVGQVTLIQGKEVRTGVTAILPHDGTIFQQKVPAAVYVGNGFGKLAGSTQAVSYTHLDVYKRQVLNTITV